MIIDNTTWMTNKQTKRQIVCALNILDFELIYFLK